MTLITEQDLDINLANKINNSMQVNDKFGMVLHFNANGNDRTGNGTEANPFRDVSQWIRNNADKTYYKQLIKFIIKGDYQGSSLALDYLHGSWYVFDFESNNKNNFTVLQMRYCDASRIEVNNLDCKHTRIESVDNVLIRGLKISGGFEDEFGVKINNSNVRIEGLEINDKLNGLRAENKSYVNIQHPLGKVEKIGLIADYNSNIESSGSGMKCPIASESMMFGKVEIKK